MLSLLGAMGRLCAIFALGVLFIPATLISVTARSLGAGSLDLADWCLRQIVRLQGGAE